MTSAGRYLRSVSAAAPAAQRELNVRFTSASGLIVPVRKPLNSFGWIGPGKLHFDERGLTITARRWTLLGLRQTRHLIQAAEISDVFREGAAIQVHLLNPRRAYFRMWAEDAESAARIVALLPTRHTIEFETEFREPQTIPARRGSAVWLVAALSVVIAGFLIWLAGSRAGPQHPAQVATVAVPTAPPPAAAPSAPLDTSAQRADRALAEKDLARIVPRLDTLAGEFSTALDALMDGTVSQQRFADELEQWLLPQWDELEAQVRRADAAPNSLHERADGELMAAINNWQLALRSYAEDLRNHHFVERAFAYIGSAQMHRGRAWRLQGELEQQAHPATAAASEAPARP